MSLSKLMSKYTYANAYRWNKLYMRCLLNRPTIKNSENARALPKHQKKDIATILHKSIASRYRTVRVADGPITARYRFIINASWGEMGTSNGKYTPDIKQTKHKKEQMQKVI